MANQNYKLSTQRCIYFRGFASLKVVLVAVVLGRTSVDAALVNVQYNTNVMPNIDKHLN